MAIGSFWKDVENAKPSSGSGYPRLQAGDYLLKVLSLRLDTSKNQKTAGQTYAVADFEIVQSSTPSFKPGDNACWLKMSGALPEYIQGFKADIRILVAAICGVDDKTITEKDMLVALDNDGAALAGELVRCKVAGGKNPDYPNHYFLPVDASQAA
jgi:hypothetical protein